MDILKNNLILGVGLALAAAVVAPILIPVAGRVGRPLAKSLVKSGMLMYEKGREAIAVAGESVEDIMAEIRAEDVVVSASNSAEAPTWPGAPVSEAERPSGGNGASPITQRPAKAGEQGLGSI